MWDNVAWQNGDEDCIAWTSVFTDRQMGRSVALM
jgi:hypothetical protein